jgi:uncharacterized membrane protein YcaP (DUF421 family)
MTPFDLVLILVISETTQQAFGGEDFSLTNAAILIITLISLDIALSYAKRATPAVAKWLDGKPTLLVVDGKPDRAAMSKARVDIEDILESARESRGLARLDQIRHAVLEIDGGISIIPAKGAG